MKLIMFVIILVLLFFIGAMIIDINWVKEQGKCNLSLDILYASFAALSLSSSWYGYMIWKEHKQKITNLKVDTLNGKEV